MWQLERGTFSRDKTTRMESSWKLDDAKEIVNSSQAVLMIQRNRSFDKSVLIISKIIGYSFRPASDAITSVISATLFRDIGRLDLGHERSFPKGTQRHQLDNVFHYPELRSVDLTAALIDNSRQQAGDATSCTKHMSQLASVAFTACVKLGWSIRDRVSLTARSLGPEGPCFRSASRAILAAPPSRAHVRPTSKCAYETLLGREPKRSPDFLHRVAAIN